MIDLLKLMQVPNKRNAIGQNIYVSEYIAFPNENAAVAAAVMLHERS